MTPPSPLALYPYAVLHAWCAVHFPPAASFLDGIKREWRGGEIMSIDFVDRERSPVDDYGMSAEDIEGMTWLRAALGGDEVLLIRRPW